MGRDRGSYRSIYSTLPDSLDFRALHADARHVFLTLKVSRLNNVAGIFIFAEGERVTLQGQVGRTAPIINRAIDLLCDTGWIAIQYPILWIINHLRFEPSVSLNNSKQTLGVLKVLKTLPNAPITAKYCEYYGLAYPFDTPSKGYQYPIRYKETDTEKETEKEKETETEKETATESSAKPDAATPVSMKRKKKIKQRPEVEFQEYWSRPRSRAALSNWSLKNGWPMEWIKEELQKTIEWLAAQEDYDLYSPYAVFLKRLENEIKRHKAKGDGLGMPVDQERTLYDSHKNRTGEQGGGPQSIGDVIDGMKNK